MITTLTGKSTLWDLVQKVGVRNRVQYHYIVETIATQKMRSMMVMTIQKDKTHDYGLIFNDGFEIRNVSGKVFRYCECETILKRERV